MNIAALQVFATRTSKPKKWTVRPERSSQKRCFPISVEQFLQLRLSEKCFARDARVFPKNVTDDEGKPMALGTTSFSLQDPSGVRLFVSLRP